MGKSSALITIWEIGFDVDVGKGFEIMNPLSHMFIPNQGDIIKTPSGLILGLENHPFTTFNHLDRSFFTSFHLPIYLDSSIHLFIHPSIPLQKNKTQPIRIPHSSLPCSPRPLQSLALQSPCSRCHNPNHCRQRWKGCRPVRQVKWRY